MNAILLVAVIVLFFMYNSIASKLDSINEQKDVSKESKQIDFTNGKQMPLNAKIAYINIDTLDSKYEYIKDYSAALRNKQAAIESSLSSMYNKFQQDYADFQQSVQAGLKPEAELKRQQAVLEQKQNEIAMKEKSLQSLGEEVTAKQNDMLRSVSAFISRYNNGKYDYILAYTSNVSSVLYAKPDLEITKEIVTGLNAEYKKSKEQKK